MLQILSSRNIVSINELATMLETNPRNIPEFRKELEVAGYFILSTPGKYGGYSLDKSRAMPSARLTSSEINVIKKASDYLNKRQDFLEKKEFQMAIGKVTANNSRTADNEDDTTQINSILLAMEDGELRDRYFSIKKCVEKHQKIKMTYVGLDNIEKTRTVHPYKLYIYNSAWYMIAWDELSNDIKYFKINRMKSFEILNDTFKVLYTYKESNLLDKHGMKQNGDWHKIKLQITGYFAVLTKDLQIGKNQSITPIDNNTIHLTCEMQNIDRIIKYTLGFGSSCKVIEPIWLKEKIKDECTKMLRQQ